MEQQLRRLEAELAEHRESLPRHSLRPAQLLEIERLEEEIAELKAKLQAAEKS